MLRTVVCYFPRGWMDRVESRCLEIAMENHFRLIGCSRDVTSSTLCLPGKCPSQKRWETGRHGMRKWTTTFIYINSQNTAFFLISLLTNKRHLCLPNWAENHTLSGGRQPAQKQQFKNSAQSVKMPRDSPVRVSLPFSVKQTAVHSIIHHLMIACLRIELCFPLVRFPSRMYIIRVNIPHPATQNMSVAIYKWHAIIMITGRSC